MIRSSIINRYLVKEILFSFLISFLFFFFVFFVNQILYIMGQMLKEMPFIEVLKLVWYSLPIVIALSFPFGVLVGALMAIGKLSFDNEILACLSSGISYFKIYIPIIFIGIVLSIISFIINDYLQPLGNSKSRKLRRELIQRNPDLILKPFSTKIYKDRVIINGDVNSETGIEDLVIIDRNEDGLNRVIMAEKAKMLDGELQQGLLTLSLNSVFSLSADEHKSSEFEYFTSDSMKYNILFSDMQTTNTSITPEEMRSVDIYKGVRRIKDKLSSKVKTDILESYSIKSKIEEEYNTLISMKSINAQSINRLQNLQRDYIKKSSSKIKSRELLGWQIGLYQKILIPLSCLSFLLLAFPLGLTNKRSGKMMGFGVGLFITIVYWSLLMGTKIYAYKGVGNTLLIMAIPNIFVLLITAIIIPIRFKK
ncbi:YjgP/YjgQ family permease [Thiospirochaeta perfilievii]|uniref:YjgP/YjgQ family permease n=1 Tax=Thiospirochaeta perfilievii TaxID=252967 RepID=A0A5C1QDT6_9SPIO|nr:LptF/LptG family permease [Thiospirochaeta perfilievii]QEN06235.1 YjgP/YjgQ family permease [Thiospirochaeta perfilievii]